MLTNNQLPKEALWAAMECQQNGGSVSSIIAAAINAWPGMTAKQPTEYVALFHCTAPAIILPLTEPRTSGEYASESGYCGGC